MTAPVRLSLLDAPSSLLPVPKVHHKEVETWWADRIEIVLGLFVEAALRQWARELRKEAPPSFPGWRPEGPGRAPTEALPMIEWLLQHAGSGTTFTFNAIWKEKQGGRSYPFFIPGYDGPLTISKRQYEAAGSQGPRHLLAAIRRDVRALFRLPEGWNLVEVDFKSCHSALALALSGDDQLAADLDGDVHQTIGDMLAPDQEPPRRRGLGKAVNNAMLFGIGAAGLKRLVPDEIGRGTTMKKANAAWTSWWARYPKLAAFRDRVQNLVRQAQTERRSLEVIAPSDRASRFREDEVAGTFKKHGPAPGPDGAWRSIFSACFRAAEGDLLDRTLAHFHENSKAGGRLVLPIYDGLLAAAPTGAEDAAFAELGATAKRAISDLGIPKLRLVRKRG